uniref:Uncharacterized protein n=1 Tax=Timema shepardi TaxID=629360 RepID=A0A7R9B010_TIMSH|nr:unnamed protein product [Timema shepardi]
MGGVNVHSLIEKFSINAVTSCAYGLRGEAFNHPNPEFYKIGKSFMEPNFKKWLTHMCIILAPWLASFLKIGLKKPSAHLDSQILVSLPHTYSLVVRQLQTEEFRMVTHLRCGITPKKKWREEEWPFMPQSAWNIKWMTRRASSFQHYVMLSPLSPSFYPLCVHLAQASAELASHYALLVSCSPGSVKVCPKVLSRCSPQAQSTGECNGRPKLPEITVQQVETRLLASCKLSQEMGTSTFTCQRAAKQQRRVENHLGKTTPDHPIEIQTSISPSSAVELNTTSALANYAT